MNSSTGEITVKSGADIDFESRQQYRVTLQVSDNKDDMHETSPTIDDTVTIVINVNNVEEPGSLTLSSQTPEVGALIRAALTDPDGRISNLQWQWASSSTPGGAFTSISGGVSASYAPTASDQNLYLQVTVTYTDGHGVGKNLTATTNHAVPPEPANHQPTFSSDLETFSVDENTLNSSVGTVSATDSDAGDTLAHSIAPTQDQQAFEDDFNLNSSTGEITVKSGADIDFESRQQYRVTLQVSDNKDDMHETSPTIDDTVTIVINVNNVEEPGSLTLSSQTPEVGALIRAALTDPDGRISNLQWQWASSSTPGGAFTSISGGVSASYAPTASDQNLYLQVTVTYTDGHGVGKNLTATTNHAVPPDPANHQPSFARATYDLTVSSTATADTLVGVVSATDPDQDVLSYSITGTDAAAFAPTANFPLDGATGRITVRDTASLTPGANYQVTVGVSDGKDGDGNADAAIDASVPVTIRVSSLSTSPGSGGGGGSFGGGGGGGGSGSSGPSPSTLDFEWTVKHDIEGLDSGHDTPSGLWSDGATLWIAENGDGADDAIYAYDLASGERAEEREFELDEANRAPRGVWSDGSTVWVSDSGRNRLFAHNLESGERLEERDIALAERNRDARGIWSDEETMWVLDGGKDSLFAYDLATGDPTAEYALDSTNGDPRGLFFDGVTFWVSDHGAKRLFAYRLEAGEDGEAEIGRNRDEEFPNTILSRASNNSPRGIWSDGEVMYVADESDDKVYTYNMPDAIDARLASLTLSGVEIGEFSPNHEVYEGVPGEGVTETTVEATTVQRRTAIAIDPPDADGNEANGHQVALEGVSEITVTVTSADGSRTKTYRVAFKQAVAEIALDAGWNTFAWPGDDGVAIADALQGDGDLANDVSATVAALYARREVAVAGRPVAVTTTEYLLLAELSAAAGEVITYRQLLRRVWKLPDDGDVRPVRTIVKKLRHKLGDDASTPSYIFNEPRVGYRMAMGEHLADTVS